MSIYKAAINRPVTALMVFFAVVVFGLFALERLPIDQLPEIDPPYVSIMTAYAGANSSEIETNVTEILENTLNSIDGLKEITSTSKDNMSLIVLEFDWGTNLDEATNDIRSAIDMVTEELPDECSTPLIFKLSTSMMPVLQYAITAKESYPGLEKILDDQVVTVLNRIDGIGNISLSGAPERYIYIELDPQKLNGYGLSLEQVGTAISGNNLNLASGSVKMGKEQYQLRVEGEFIESAEIGDIVVSTTADGRQVFVRDVALVRDTIKDISVEERVNGEEGVRLMITKRTGANSVQIATEVRRQMEIIQKNLPHDIHFDIIYDSSEDIINAIKGLSESIFFALLFVTLVVLFFIGKWRATLIISLTIPISLLTAFIYLLLADSSINIISLCSLTIAVGMVVDDAIVVLENIAKHIERGSRPREAAIYATNEVWVSVIATTLVIVAVFMPLTMLPGQAGVLFKELGWIVTIVVCTSTLIAISLTPMLASKLLKGKKVTVDESGRLVEVASKQGWYERFVVKGLLDKIDVLYSRLLGFCLNHKLLTLLVAGAMFCVSLVPFFTGAIGTDFMQEQDNGRMSLTVELQRGTRVEETARIARIIEQRIVALVPETRLISTSLGSNDEADLSAMFSSTNNNKISMTVRCTKKNARDRSIFQIAETIRNDLKTMPEIVSYKVENSSMSSSMGSTGIDVEVYGHSFDETNRFVRELRELISAIPEARDIEISREEDRAELQVIFDKEKLARHGLNQSTAATYVRNRVNGMSCGYLREDGEEYDIVVRLAEEHRNTITRLQSMTVPTADGSLIPLSELATIEEYWCPPEIERQSRQRIVTLAVTPYGISQGEMAEKINGILDKVDIPQGVNVHLGGAYEDQQETFGDIGTLFLLILVLVYVVMASQFESYSQPTIIMMAIPFAITGVIISLLLTSTSLDMIGALGVVLLVGIVVKNGIVLVDFTNLMVERGHPLHEAIVLSGKSRLRPVLMTAVTTILGMVPMALNNSEGSEMWQPLGIVVIGGATLSTLITLVIVPVLYSLISRRSEEKKKKDRQKRYIFTRLSPRQAR